MTSAVLSPPLIFKIPGWSERPPESLEAKRDEIKPPAFERSFRQKPHSSEDLFFPNFKPGKAFFYNEDWERISDSGSPEYDPTNPAYVDPAWKRYSGVDRSSKKRRGTVVATIAISPYAVRHLIDIRIGAWTIGETCDQIQEVFETHKPVLIYVENNALQEDTIDTLKEREYSCWHVVEGFTTGKQKTSVEIGLPSLDSQFEQDMWRISIPHGRYEIAVNDPGNPGICGCDICSLVSSLSTFTWADLDITPDSVMALWFAKEASRFGEGFDPRAFSVSTMSSSDIQDAISSDKINAALEQMRLPVGVPVYVNGKFGKKKNTFDFGRFKSKSAYEDLLEQERARKQDAQIA